LSIFPSNHFYQGPGNIPFSNEKKISDRSMVFKKNKNSVFCQVTWNFQDFSLMNSGQSSIWRRWAISFCMSLSFLDQAKYGSKKDWLCFDWNVRFWRFIWHSCQSVTWPILSDLTMLIQIALCLQLRNSGQTFVLDTTYKGDIQCRDLSTLYFRKS
jgi:hypothetical protein